MGPVFQRGDGIKCVAKGCGAVAPGFIAAFRTVFPAKAGIPSERTFASDIESSSHTPETHHRYSWLSKKPNESKPTNPLNLHVFLCSM
jgi:hypothetical protein